MTAAQSIVAATHVLLMALENFVPTRAANMYAQHGEAGLTRYMRRVTLLGGACILSIVVVGSVWAEFWLHLFFGAAYRGNGWIVPWWGGFHLLSFLQRPFSVGLRVLGHTKGMFLATASSAIVAVTLSYPLISNWWACTAPCLLSVSCKLREWRWWHSRYQCEVAQGAA